MATLMTVLATDLEDGDLADFSEVAIIETNLLQVPADYVRVTGDAEEIDNFNVRVPVSDGYVIVVGGEAVKFGGNVYDEDPENDEYYE